MPRRPTAQPIQDAVLSSVPAQRPATTNISTALALSEQERTGLAVLDDVQRNCTLQAISSLSSQAERSIVLAKAITAAEQALEPFRTLIESLRCTPLGFMLDKPEQYEWPIMRRVIAEGMLRGARFTGNEINGISKRCYLTQAYYVRRCREWPGVSITLEMFGVPRQANGQTVVDCRIDYDHERPNAQGQPIRHQETYDRTATNAIPIKVNDGMGPDAILGKAKRKAYAGLMEQLINRSGESWSPGTDGEVEDVTGQPRQTQAIVSDSAQPQTTFTSQTGINYPQWHEAIMAAQSGQELADVGRRLTQACDLRNGLWTPTDTQNFGSLVSLWLGRRLMTCNGEANAIRAVRSTIEAIHAIRPFGAAVMAAMNRTIDSAGYPGAVMTTTNPVG